MDVKEEEKEPEPSMPSMSMTPDYGGDEEPPSHPHPTFPTLIQFRTHLPTHLDKSHYERSKSPVHKPIKMSPRAPQELIWNTSW